MEDGLIEFELQDPEALCLHDSECLRKWMETPELPEASSTADIHCEHGVWIQWEHAVEEWKSGL